MFEVVHADLLDPSSLVAAFEGAYGAFVVTNFWEPNQGAREEEIGAAAVRAAREAGVEHLIWSRTLTPWFEAPVSPGTRSYKHPSTFKTSSP